MLFAFVGTAGNCNMQNKIPKVGSVSYDFVVCPTKYFVPKTKNPFGPIFMSSPEEIGKFVLGSKCCDFGRYKTTYNKKTF